ncbi:hypothetical protein BaRGS_00022275 [Batillaria attramentaria]|uniref:Uncharacterized protein n=1 Tax=Batillaria attramentaria TaxID=370345 RepID=A0ABD0KHH8_9CAEN
MHCPNLNISKTEENSSCQGHYDSRRNSLPQSWAGESTQAPKPTQRKGQRDHVLTGSWRRDASVGNRFRRGSGNLIVLCLRMLMQYAPAGGDQVNSQLDVSPGPTEMGTDVESLISSSVAAASDQATKAGGLE